LLAKKVTNLEQKLDNLAEMVAESILSNNGNFPQLSAGHGSRKQITASQSVIGATSAESMVVVPSSSSSLPGHTAAPHQASYATMTAGPSKASIQPRKKLLVVGKVTSCNSKITAAKPIPFKTVLHVDNIDNSVTIADVTEFMNGNGIEVISCFDSKSWRNPIGDGVKAMRICVPRDQSARVLDCDLWPKGIIVRPWVFKKAETSGKPITDDENGATTVQL
jgi:hypothetical protein